MEKSSKIRVEVLMEMDVTVRCERGVTTAGDDTGRYIAVADKGIDYDLLELKETFETAALEYIDNEIFLDDFITKNK